MSRIPSRVKMWWLPRTRRLKPSPNSTVHKSSKGNARSACLRARKRLVRKRLVRRETIAGRQLALGRTIAVAAGRLAPTRALRR